MSSTPRPEQPPSGGPPDKIILTVSALTALVKGVLLDHLPPTVRVLGQISNFKRHSSGHLYFTLKDADSELACVMWRSAASTLQFQPADGLDVIATGGIDLFERAGRYQLYTRKLEPRGVGALELAFRQMREKLEAEGLFDPAHKKPLPRLPRQIAVVTSPTGAAIRDILQTLARRYPPAAVFIFPVAVQGPSAAGQIASAIADLNRRSHSLGGIDLLIVGRGGGSLEDLWAFNEEIVARAIFASRIPIISAVGHEVDVSIADLVADVRAATPTAAAELAVPDRADLLANIERLGRMVSRACLARLELSGIRFHNLLHRRTLAEPLWFIESRGMLLDEFAGRMARTLEQRLRSVTARLRTAEQALACIAPYTFLLQQNRALAHAQNRLELAVARAISRSANRLQSAAADLRPRDLSERINRRRDQVATLEHQMARALTARLGDLNRRIDHQHRQLSAMSYQGTLRRGFTITRQKKGGELVRSPEQVTDGTKLTTETAGGTFESVVVNRRQLELFE